MEENIEKYEWAKTFSFIFNRHILFYYLTPGWRQKTFDMLYEHFLELDMIYRASSYDRDWRILLKDGVSMQAIPAHSKDYRCYRGDLLIFEDGVTRKWINLHKGRNRWYNGRDYVLTFDGEIIDERDYEG